MSGPQSSTGVAETGLIGEKPGRARTLMLVLWPAFLMAGVLEALVFSLVNPQELSWFETAGVDVSLQAVYTLAFLVFWLILSLASTITLLMSRLSDVPDAAHPKRWPQ